jgi:hypothetical protein
MSGWTFYYLAMVVAAILAVTFGALAVDLDQHYDANAR